MAAASGRLVIASLSANSVWEVLLAYLKLKMPLKQRLDSLKLITNQRISPLKRAPKKSSKKNSQRAEIGIFEVLTMTPNLKEFLIKTEDDKTKEKFWEQIFKLAIKEGYEPLLSDHKQKIKNGLLKDK